MLTIEELAERAGMTVRNVRAHQSRGLLPPARRDGRRRSYGAEHVERLELIAALQRAGVNLVAVEVLLGSGYGALERLALLRADVLAALEVTATAELGAAQRAELEGLRPGLLDELVEQGVLLRLPDGGYAAMSRTLLAAARALQQGGVPVTTIVGVQQDAFRAVDGLVEELGARLGADTVARLSGPLHVLVGELVARRLAHGLGGTAGYPATVGPPNGEPLGSPG